MICLSGMNLILVLITSHFDKSFYTIYCILKDFIQLIKKHFLELIFNKFDIQCSHLFLMLVFFPGTPGKRQHVLAIIETLEHYTT